MSVLPWSLSCSPLLDCTIAHPPSARSNEPDGTVAAVCIDPRPSLKGNAPSCTDIIIVTTSATSSTLDITAYPSSRTISLFTRSESCASLFEKSVRSLPSSDVPITTRDIISIMKLLNNFDDDVTKEVARVKENIKNTREIVSAFRAERIAHRESLPECQRQELART
ncbi:hypothetical protein HWV62_7402 [Athelia sp. TMB]|nr:hypothetical protein HWV62_7402 [Athelia sp. TMB]